MLYVHQFIAEDLFPFPNTHDPNINIQISNLLTHSLTLTDKILKN